MGSSSRTTTPCAAAIYQLGAILRPADLRRAAEDIATIVESLLTCPLAEISTATSVEAVRIGTRYDAPPELVLVAKQLMYFERYGKLMAPDWAVLNDAELLCFLFKTLVDDNP